MNLLPSDIDRTVKKNLYTFIGVQATGLILPQIFYHGGILPLFILNIGGGDFHIGLLFAMFTGLNLLRVFAGPYTDYYNKKKLLMYSWGLSSLVSVLFIFLILCCYHPLCVSP